MNHPNQPNHPSHPSASPGQHRFGLRQLGTLLCLSVLLAYPQSIAKPRKKTAHKPIPAHSSTALGENAHFIDKPELQQFIADMVEKYQFDPYALEKTLRQTNYVESAVKLIKPAPPGRKKDWQAYRRAIVEPIRIKAGVQFWDQYADALARAERDYGVPAEIIVGILGVETIYGRITGNFRVMDVLTTLAFAYPDAPNRLDRMNFFRNQLAQTLLLARESDTDPFSLRGSFAGAIGLPQFMPGSIRQFAIDFDGDGKIDLRQSPLDAIGSIAFFLQHHGWRTGQPIIFPASVLTSNDETPAPWQRFLNQGLSAKFTLQEILEAGVKTPSTPQPDLLFGLVDLQNGEQANEYYLATNNFFTITQYNRSYFYAMSVIELGNTIRQRRGL